MSLNKLYLLKRNELVDIYIRLLKKLCTNDKVAGKQDLLCILCKESKLSSIVVFPIVVLFKSFFCLSYMSKLSLND